MSMQAPVLNVDSKTFNPISNNQVSNSGFNNYQKNNSPNSPNSPNVGVYDEVKELGVNEVNEVNQVREVINSFDSTQNKERNVLLVKSGEGTRRDFNQVNQFNQVSQVNQLNQINYEVRNIYVEIQRSRLNRLRSYLERLKKPFEADPYNLRIADAPIIDAMIGCAVVSSKTVKEYLDKAYSTPAYLPPEDEVFQLSAQEEPKTQEQKRREREERNLNRNLRVELSSASSERILNLQMELTQLMGWQPDINALGNALLDLSQHKSRKIVESIADHYKNASKKEENKQEVTAL